MSVNCLILKTFCHLYYIMSFLKRLTSSSKSHTEAEVLVEKLQWNIINAEQELDLIEEQSKLKPQIVFKHSTRCGVSSMVLRRFERQAHEVIQGMDFHMVDVISNRAVSNAIAGRYGIMHQSPQLIVIKNSTAVFNDSHYEIINSELESYL